MSAKDNTEKQPPEPEKPAESSHDPEHSKKKLILLIGLAVLLLIAGIAAVFAFGGSDSQKSASDDEVKPTLNSIPAKTVDTSGAYKLENVTAGTCSALLPAGWPAPVVNEASTSFDAFNADKTMYAGYGHQTINEQLAPFASAYDPPLNDPDLYSSDPAVVSLAFARIIVANMGGDNYLNYSFDTNETLGDYTLRSFAGSTHKGVVFFHSAGFPGDGFNYTYSLPMYFAITPADAWQSDGLSMARVAASISCSAQLIARDTGPDIGGESPEETSTDSNGSEDGYNPYLGTEYVNDPNTKENYLVDPSRDWSSDGPAGGGYYKTNGNDYTRLEPGRSD